MVFPMAERTTMGTVVDSKPQTMSATSIMRSAVATDEPPNLTTRLMGGASFAPHGGESGEGCDDAAALARPTSPHQRCAACHSDGVWRGRRFTRVACTGEVRIEMMSRCARRLEPDDCAHAPMSDCWVERRR